jgi:hypothetical protein
LNRIFIGSHSLPPSLVRRFGPSNGGAAADDTVKGYMRRVTGGGSTTSSRWLSNEGCLHLHEKAAHVLHYKSWHIWGEPLPPPAQVRGDQPCAGMGGDCAVEKGWLRISLFCSEDCRLHYEMVKFAQRIGNQ